MMQTAFMPAQRMYICIYIVIIAMNKKLFILYSDDATLVFSVCALFGRLTNTHCKHFFSDDDATTYDDATTNDATTNDATTNDATANDDATTNDATS
jgi:hypothetical protein